MKTLVIHPIDSSTDFLSEIYGSLYFTQVRHVISKSKLKTLIKEHDRIIMLGHGDERGLFDLANKRFAIDSSLVYLLREKECICIWCNADKFVTKYKLNSCFYTGMFISEIDEALYEGCSYGNLNDTINEIHRSNKDFSDAVRISILNDDFYYVNKLYCRNSGIIYDFNKERIFINKI